MPLYPQYAPYLQTAALAYQREHLRFPPAYEENYLQNLEEALHELQNTHSLWAPENCAALTRQPLDNYHFAADFRKLRQAGILLQPVFNALIANIRFSAELTEGFLILQRGGLLGFFGNIEALTQNPRRAPELAHAFIALQQASLFNAETRSALLNYPQLLPAVLLFLKNKLLNKVTWVSFVKNLAHLNNLTGIFTELALDHALNAGTYLEVIQVAHYAHLLQPAVMQLRLVGRLKGNLSTLIQNREHSKALSEGIFNFYYGEVVLEQDDLDLLFKFAPQAQPLSSVMIALKHLNLLQAYRPLLAEQGLKAETLLALFDLLKEKGLFVRDNIAVAFRQIHHLDKLLQACKAHPALTQPEFNRLVGELQAERRLHLAGGSSGLEAGNAAGSHFFGAGQSAIPIPKDNAQKPHYRSKL